MLNYLNQNGMNSFINNYDTTEKLIYEEGLKINVLHFHPDLDLMLIVLSNKKVLKRAISSSLRLGQATSDQLKNCKLIGKGRSTLAGNR